MHGTELTSHLLLEHQPHTAAKHRLLERYLGGAFRILATFRRVVFVDGFAGPGRYKDGSIGSPMVALKTLIDHRGFNSQPMSSTDYHFVFVEKDRGFYGHLQWELSANAPFPKNVHVDLRSGQFEFEMRALLRDLEDQYERAALIAFIDPFGYSGVPFNLIRDLANNQVADVIINFATSSMVQWGEDPSKSQAMSGLFGTEEWKDCLKPGVPDKDRCLLALYERQLLKAGMKVYGSAFRMVNVNNATQYYLVYAGKDAKGLEVWKDAAHSVGQDGNFQFSDFRDPHQQSFGKWISATSIPAEHAENLMVDRPGERVAIEVLRAEVGNHPYLRRPNLTSALTSLETDLRIMVERPKGKSQRVGQYPDGTFITFARPLI